MLHLFPWQSFLTIGISSGGPIPMAVTTDTVTNVSGVPGATCSDALDNLDTDVSALASSLATIDTTDVANTSAVAGAKCTDALNTLNTAIGALTSTSIANSSGVVGAKVTNALNTLNSDISTTNGVIAALDSTDIANLSTAPGAKVTDALNQLDADLGSLNSNDIGNSSSVSGLTVTAALDDLSLNKAPAALGGISDVTASTTASSSWVNGLVPVNSASPVVITVNTNAFGGKGKGAVFFQSGAGLLSFASGTATVRSRGNLLNSAGQYSFLSLVQLDSGGTLFGLAGDRA